MTSNFRYLLELLRCAVSGSTPPPIPEGVTPEAVFSLAKRHSVFLLAFDCAMQLSSVRENPHFSAWMQQYQIYLTKSLNQTYEIKHLAALLNTEGIAHVFLKGSSLRKLYPTPELREMCDIDVLVPVEQAEEAYAAAQRDGYVSNGSATHNEAFFKPPFIELELHTYMVPTENKYFDYYRSVWSRARREGSSDTYTFGAEDAYIFALVHTWKHYVGHGTGIRPILDVAVLEKTYGDRLDRAYLKAELEKLSLTDFGENVMQLAACWFGTERTELTAQQQRLEHRLLAGATYGTKEQSESNLLMKKMQQGKSERRAKTEIFFRQVFPPYSTMASRFRWVGRVPVLLPAAWVARWGQLLVTKPVALKRYYRWVRGLQLLQDDCDELKGKK